MKKAVLLYKRSTNIGDDIQCIAALNLLGEKDTLILDRENLHENEESSDIKLLCNGWFMFNAENWPPAKNIHPYFISFHIAKYNRIRKLMLAENLVPYYQQFEPIGCRDHVTLNLFNKIGIKSYFSGCATLTMDKSRSKRSNDIIVTDPFINDLLTEEYARKVTFKLIPKEFHPQVKLKTHIRKNTDISIEEQLNEGKELLKEYAQAKLVITSRIHCALPCLALGTPVYFVDFGYIRKINRDRFDGILDLMHTVRPILPFHENRRIDKVLKFFNIHRLFFNTIKPLSINWENPEPNPDDYKNIAADIKKRIAAEFKDL
ncbi:MAG: polysaccharide pyruvyl transferase family protein [Reichenbachiella sp.]